MKELQIDKSWNQVILKSLDSLSKNYFNFLQTNKNYFPNKDNFLNAFKTLSLDNTKAILFGQDPYPRAESAIGYAFIDGRVKDIFSENGLSKEVNKATSLRNFIKMLLVSNGKITKDELTQQDIATLNKTNFIKNIYDLKDNFERNGVLLLNTSLIFTCKNDTKQHVKEFKPFIKTLLNEIKHKEIELILFGNMAQDIKKSLPPKHNFRFFEFCHPYNNRFITDELVCEYFSKIKLLEKIIS